MLLVLVFTLLATRPQVVTVEIGNATISATIADTSQARSNGLSGTSDLAANCGMLFVFPADQAWQFWMKDMHYNLDIIWLDATKKVVHVVNNASPDSYPFTVFAPSASARYVLEINGGEAKKTDITVGERATFALP